MSQPACYRETLRVPVVWWLLGALLCASVWWAFFVATPAFVAAAAGVVAGSIIVGGLVAYGSVRIQVDDEGLRAGRAFLPWPHVGRSVALDSIETRRHVGVSADARAFLVLRTYCPGSVKILVADRNDPTPYWIVSSRHARALADRLGERSMQD